MDSPWPGYFVKCFPQVLFNGEWGNAEWHDFYNGGPHQGNGVRCNLLGNDKIVVVSGSYFILQDLGPHFQGYPFIVPDSQSVRSAPCRIYCEKGGPLPS
jgi:hypothetical protein